MLDEIKKLREKSVLLDPDEAARNVLLEKITGYSQSFLESIPDDKAITTNSENGRALYDSPVGEKGISVDNLLEILHKNVNSIGLNPTSGRFLGYIPGGGLFYSALGDYLAAISNRFAGVFFAGPGAVRIENMLVKWMSEIVGYPESSAGYLSSGGSTANLTAIVTARDSCGISGNKIINSVVYVTGHTHHCIRKALKLAGLGECFVRNVPVDANYRMDAGSLDEIIKVDRKIGLNPWLVIASAGTTNTGSVDPLNDIKEIASKHNLWYHVDGAYGAFFVLCPEVNELLRGMGESDSIVMDPHKTLFLPYGTGALIVRDGKKLYSSHCAEADYIESIIDDIDELSPADLSPELTKHFRGLRLWLPLKLAGVESFRAALSEKILLARYFYEQIQRIDGFEVGPFPDLSVVTYRYIPKRGDENEFNQQLMREIINDGRIFISSTKINGNLVLRAAVGCFRTHLDEIEEALEVLNRMSEKLNNS